MVLYIAIKLDGFMDHELVKIKIVITGVLDGRLKWRARHHTPALDIAVTDRINENVVALFLLFLFFLSILLIVSRLYYVKYLIIFLFVVGITSVTSLHILIMVTLFLHEK
jgi:hypothetical protein